MIFEVKSSLGEVNYNMLVYCILDIDRSAAESFASTLHHLKMELQKQFPAINDDFF